ncbi:hypothetical protein M426DRAFT_8425 [Hypoxylon sp. CI-4A]|nr:hypothetical protein M426DRAFT_8425 [Hypoxylon sp. CI-4A]
MGRLEPLTSLALGRSPYDEVVPGEGEEDAREPEKQYDATGRIVNPQTKQIIKNVIRAHNEVMLVIGVAEPENRGFSVSDMELAKQYHEYESDTGRTLYQIGTSLGILSTWGVLNIRRRILVYKRRADASFFQLIRSESNSHSFLQFNFAGYPCHMVMHALRLSSRYFIPPAILQNAWVRGILEYTRFHLHLFLTMQRLDLIPASQWLPGPRFFIPFSSSSPFSTPPLPESLDARSLLGWAGKLVVNLAPYATFYVCGFAWQSACGILRSFIRKRLPRPTPLNISGANTRLVPIHVDTQRQTVPESPTLGAADQEIRQQTLEADAPTPLAVDQPSGEAIPVGSITRRGTFSSRGGEDYGTDEEDSEMVNPTLISFDVDTSESPDPPAGVWSAELRPSFAGDPHQSLRDTPIYIINPLTSLPSILAADVLANFITNLFFIPVDSHAFPVIARALALRRGLPFDGINDGSFLGGLTWRGVVNIMQLDLVKLLISGEVWALTTVLSQWLHVTEEEWKEIRKEDGVEGSDNRD